MGNVRGTLSPLPLSPLPPVALRCPASAGPRRAGQTAPANVPCAFPSTFDSNTTGYYNTGCDSRMRILKTLPFARFAARNGISDAALRLAVHRADAGLVDADLGGGVIKQRIARDGEGASSGYRTIILFRRGQRAVFVYGYAKKGRDNIRRNELLAFRNLAKALFGLDDQGIGHALAIGELIEVRHDA